MSENRFTGPSSGRTALPLLLPRGISIVAGTVANWFAPLLALLLRSLNDH